MTTSQGVPVFGGRRFEERDLLQQEACGSVFLLQF
eukprot:jgi/Chlat1/6727/Chrsp50S06431